MSLKDIKLNNGFCVPRVGYGTFPYQELLVEKIPLAINEGYRMVDTSDNYDNEVFVGKGLANVDKSNVVIITKFSLPYRTHELEKCFEESRKKLGGKINIYLLHWPYPWLWKEQWRRMEKLYLEGKCDAIGVCNFDIGYLKELLSFCKVKPAINQFERHPMFQQKELVDFCHANDIAVMSYSPLARMDKSLHDNNSVLYQISNKYNKTINQVILRWNIDTDTIPIPASSSLQHLKENFDIYDFNLNDEEIEMINKMESGMRIRYNPRTRHTFREKLSFLKYNFNHRFSVLSYL